MASDIEQRNFVDKAGLEQFWDDIQTYMTRMYKGLPAGMQFSRIYQENGQLHILVEPFGGATEAAKAAARASLGVGSYKGQKTLTEMNELTQEPNAGDQYNVVFPGTGFGTLVNQWDGEDPHTTVDILSGDNVMYDREGHCWDRQTGNYKTRQTATSETMADEYHTILNISQNENGEISITTQTIPTATVSKLGLTTLKGSIGTTETDNSTAATPKAVRDAIDAAIDALDVTEVTFGPVQTVGTIEEVDGKIVVTPVDIRTATTSVSGITTLTSDTVDQGALVDTETMAVTPLGVKNAIESLDVSTITGFGADKTLSALSETDGKISASFQSILAREDNIDTGAVTESKILDGSVTENKIGAGAVTEGKIGAGAVTENKIGAEAVTNTKIASNAVDTRTILDSAVTTGKINDKAVTTEKIADGAVTTDKLDATNGIDGSVLKDRSVTGIKIAEETITGSSWDPVAQQVHISNIKPGTISGREIATGNNDGINTANIVDHAITSDKLATGSVNTAHIIDAAVTTDKLYDGAVTTGKIGAQAVTAEKLATDSVTTTKILNGAVTTDKLELQAVTSATIADLNVTTGKIADDAVTTVKIADGNVTSAKIADGNVTEGKLGTDSVTTEKIKDENVTESKLATDSVTTDKIKNGNVTEGKIADGAVSRDKLAANAVTPAKVSSGTYGIDISGTAEYATHASGELATTLGNKADKKAPSQAGNLATLDAAGNLADSGIQPGDFKTKQTAVEDPAASGNSYSFIDTLSQDANGEVTVTKKTVPDATTAVRGVSQLNSSTVITTNDSSSLSEDETKAVTALGVKNAIDNLDSGDSKVETKVVRAINVTNGKIAVTKDTLGISDIDQLGTRLGNIENGKADKVANATSGNFASLDSNGNLVDSGSKAADFVQMTDLQALDLAEIGGPGEYISAIKQENGQVSATATTMDTEPTANSTNAVTSGGVRSAIDGAIAKLDVSDSAVSHQFVTAVPEADGKVSVSRAQPVIADVDGLQSELNSKQNTLTFEDTYGDYNPDTNPVPTVASITSRLGELDLASQGGADGNYISQISQTDGQVAVTVSSTLGTLDTTSSAPVNSSAVNSAITGAIAALDKSDISGFGAGKTLASLSETDGIISAKFQDITVGSSNISDGSITTPKLDQQAVTTEKIADGAITPAKVSNDTYTISIDGDAATASDAKDGSTLANKLADLGSDKADKVANATSGNFAGLDSNGNLTDSGKKASDFKTVQTAVSDPAASGTSTTFISGISQDSNGVITPSKATLPEASTTVKGIVQLKDSIEDAETDSDKAATPKSVRDAINALDVNSLTGFGQDKTLATLTETNGKISATFQNIKITKSQVSDFPTEMTPSSHTHGNITNDGKIGTTADLGIVTGPGGTVTTKDFTQASPTTGSDTTTEFISTVAQGTDGAISATKQAITPASTSAAGIVQLSSSISSSSETMAATPKAVSDLAASLGTDKADKVSGATSGNFAGLDSNGNLTDSGKKASDFATAAQGSKANTAIQGVKVNGTELNKDSLNKVDITAVTGVKGSSESTYRTGQVSITAGNVGAYTTAEVDAALALKEDAANKKQTVNTSSTTEFPTSAAVAAFVNSSIATATANFLGNYTLTDLGLTYPATNAQIEGALGSYAWPAGVNPTNNDYVLISINSSTDPDTGEPIIDEYRRFKYNDGEDSWAYEYTLNNSSFTSAQWSAINSGITAGDKSTYDDHLADTSNPHSVTAAQVGLGNVNNTADIDKPISNAAQAALDDKVDKVYTATENHIAVFDNAGNIRDSGKTYSDMQGEFKQKQTAKPSPTASGNALSFIDTVSQDADGVITATKKSVTVDSTYSSSGMNPVNGKAIKAAIDGLDAAIASNDGTNVQVKVTETDGKIAAVNITTDNTENRNNKVSSWQTTPDNTHYPTEKLVKYSLDSKVDKVEGKGLSAEDYTTAEKTKLAGIAAGAEVNQNAFSNVMVGSVTIAADSKTDTLEIAGGTGIDAVGDMTNDKVTLSLNSATQFSLGKADSAVQSVKINGGSELKDDSGNVNIPLAVATGSTGAKAGALSSDDKKKLNDLGTAAFKNVSTSGNAGNDEVVLGSDTRLSAGASAVQDVTVDGASVVNSSTKVAAVPNASTSAKGAVQLAGSIGATVASENNKAATEKAVRDAINALDSNKTSTDGTNIQVKVTEADGKISAVNITTDNTENKNNKVAAWSSTASDTNYPSEKLVKGSLDNKVDKVTGKGLSTNDYTTAEKNKLSGIEAGAEVNQNAFSSVKVGTDTIQADTKTDTLTLVAGSNVQLAADTATDTVTISATDTTYGADRGISLVSGKFGHSNAAVAGASVGPSDAVTGVSVSVPRFTFDGYGHVTSASDKTFTVRTGSTSQTGVVQLQGSIGATESENSKAATPKAVRDAINALDVASVGGSGNVIVSISETDGKISATAGKLSASGGALSYSGEIDEDFCLKLSNVVFAD